MYSMYICALHIRRVRSPQQEPIFNPLGATLPWLSLHDVEKYTNYDTIYVVFRNMQSNSILLIEMHGNADYQFQ